MALSLEKIKQDFARNKKRAAVLGVLVVVLGGFVVNAYFEMAPRTAAADATVATPVADPNAEAPMSAAETDARIRQSKELWKQLRVEQGVPAAAAFAFAPNFYNPDPSRQRVALPTVIPTAPTQTPQVNTEELNRQVREAQVKAAAQKLIVNSTVVGSGNSRPVAVVCGKILELGDRIDVRNGDRLCRFEIIAIKAREVVFKMDGVMVTVEMAGSSVSSDDHHGQ